MMRYRKRNKNNLSNFLCLKITTNIQLTVSLTLNRQSSVIANGRTENSLNCSISYLNKKPAQKKSCKRCVFLKQPKVLRNDVKIDSRNFEIKN